MNNSTRNFKMKKLLIASTALVATAGMASADITISGHAAAGFHSGLDDVTTAATDNSTDVAADGVYSNAGVDFTMTGATDNGISFSASVNIDAGEEIDTGDFEYDGTDLGHAGLGAVSMSGTFGTLTFDNNGIDNLYSDATTHDVSYATTLGAVGLTVGYDVTGGDNATSAQATYTAGGMAFTLTGSEAPGGTSTTLAVSYALNDTVTITADTDSAAGGASVGLQLALNVGAMLLAFIGLIALINGILGGIGGWFGMENLTLELLLGWIFAPLAFIIGVPWEEATIAGSFIGQKTVVNEFVAYLNFVPYIGDNAQIVEATGQVMSEKTQAIIAFALCGFANLSSIAILLGGLGGIAPGRRHDIARMGVKAVAAGTLSNLMAATIAGFCISLAAM